MWYTYPKNFSPAARGEPCRQSVSRVVVQPPILRRVSFATQTVTDEPPASAEIYRQFLQRPEETRGLSLLGGGADRIKKLTACERIEILADPGTFREDDQLVAHRCVDFDKEKDPGTPGDGVVAGALCDVRAEFSHLWILFASRLCVLACVQATA
jgi:hypothetical protein